MRVYGYDLSDAQINRYGAGETGLHEPVEEGWFEALMDRIAESGAERPVFIDGGAACGYYSLLFKFRFDVAKILAVEASDKMRKAFKRTVRLNGIEPSEFEIIPKALYPHGKSVVFAHRHFASYVKQGERDVEAGTDDAVVPTIDLEDLLSLSGGRADLVKLDIQSAELALINRNPEVLASGRIRFWIIGTHSHLIHDKLMEKLAVDHDILFEDRAPEGQPDGLIVAEFKGATDHAA